MRAWSGHSIRTTRRVEVARQSRWMVKVMVVPSDWSIVTPGRFDSDGPRRPPPPAPVAHLPRRHRFPRGDDRFVSAHPRPRLEPGPPPGELSLPLASVRTQGPLDRSIRRKPGFDDETLEAGSLDGGGPGAGRVRGS